MRVEFWGGSTRHGAFSNTLSAHDRDSPPHVGRQRGAEIASTIVLVKVHAEDQSNVKSSRTGFRHLARVEAYVEFALDASRTGTTPQPARPW